MATVKKINAASVGSQSGHRQSLLERRGTAEYGVFVDGKMVAKISKLRTDWEVSQGARFVRSFHKLADAKAWAIHEYGRPLVDIL